MSIINDALKKVQQGLKPNDPSPPASETGTSAKGSTYIYTTPPATELPTIGKNKSVQNKIKSLLIFIFATVITAGSAWYIYQQFHEQIQIDIPMIQTLTIKSFHKLAHIKELPDFKTKKPEDLKPLAQITINSPTMPTSDTTAATTPVTLNVHGVMANASGNLALINDQVYQEGDEVDGAKIVKIDLDSITVINNGKQETIPVKN